MAFGGPTFCFLRGCSASRPGDFRLRCKGAHCARGDRRPHRLLLTKMQTSIRQSVGLAGIMLVSLSGVSAAALAGDVEIVHASFLHSGGGDWSIDVTLRHADTSWEHYADAWRVVAGDAEVLGTRTLYHPHVNEQPFTRSLGGVAIPADMTTVYIEAHDKIHGWSPQRVQVNLDMSKGDRFKVSR